MLKHKGIIAMGLAGLAAGLLVLTQTAATQSGTRAYQLGGAWQGELDGVTWVGIHTPLDPNGKRAAVKWQWMTANSDTLGLMQLLGATSMSDCVGDIVMRTSDTADYKTVTYLIGPNTGTGFPELKLKMVMTGTWHFLNENTVETVDLLKFYWPDGTSAAPLIPDKSYLAHKHYRIAVDN